MALQNPLFPPEKWESILREQLWMSEQTIENFRKLNLVDTQKWPSTPLGTLLKLGMTVEETVRFNQYVLHQESTAVAKPPPGREKIGVLISKCVPQAQLVEIFRCELQVVCRIHNYQSSKPHDVTQFELSRMHFENLKSHFKVLSNILGNVMIEKIRVKECKFDKKCVNKLCYYYHREGLDRDGLTFDIPENANEQNQFKKMLSGKIPCRWGNDCKDHECSFFHEKGMDREGLRIKIGTFCLKYAIGKQCDQECKKRRRHTAAKHIICPNKIAFGKCHIIQQEGTCPYAHEYGTGVFDLFPNCLAVKNAKRGRRKQERKRKKHTKRLKKLEEAKKREEENLLELKQKVSEQENGENDNNNINLEEEKEKIENSDGNNRKEKKKNQNQDKNDDGKNDKKKNKENKIVIKNEKIENNYNPALEKIKKLEKDIKKINQSIERENKKREQINHDFLILENNSKSNHRKRRFESYGDENLFEENSRTIIEQPKRFPRMGGEMDAQKIFQIKRREIAYEDEIVVNDRNFREERDYEQQNYYHQQRFRRTLPPSPGTRSLIATRGGRQRHVAGDYFGGVEPYSHGSTPEEIDRFLNRERRSTMEDRERRNVMASRNYSDHDLDYRSRRPSFTITKDYSEHELYDPREIVDAHGMHSRPVYDDYYRQREEDYLPPIDRRMPRFPERPRKRQKVEHTPHGIVTSQYRRLKKLERERYYGDYER